MVCICIERKEEFAYDSLLCYWNVHVAYLPIENNVLAAAENTCSTDLVPRSLVKEKRSQSGQLLNSLAGQTPHVRESGRRD